MTITPVRILYIQTALLDVRVSVCQHGQECQDINTKAHSTKRYYSANHSVLYSFDGNNRETRDKKTQDTAKTQETKETQDTTKA